MTDEPTKALIKYRIERAEETFKEGLLMRTEDHWNACANRLYYDGQPLSFTFSLRSALRALLFSLIFRFPSGPEAEFPIPNSTIFLTSAFRNPNSIASNLPCCISVKNEDVTPLFLFSRNFFMVSLTRMNL